MIERDKEQGGGEGAINLEGHALITRFYFIIFLCSLLSSFGTTHSSCLAFFSLSHAHFTFIPTHPFLSSFQCMIFQSDMIVSVHYLTLMFSSFKRRSSSSCCNRAICESSRDRRAEVMFECFFLSPEISKKKRRVVRKEERKKERERERGREIGKHIHMQAVSLLKCNVKAELSFSLHLDVRTLFIRQLGTVSRVFPTPKSGNFCCHV